MAVPGLDVAPPEAADVFGDRLELAERFAVHLATSAVERGLLGPREVPRLWTRHLLNCAVVVELAPPSSAVIDVGSGAGLPGLAMAIARPDLRVTLVEPLERRVGWLHEVVEDLQVDVSVVRGRAEELHGEVSAPVATARAVAPLPRLAEWGLPLVAPGGVLLALKGQRAAAELDKSVATLRRLGAQRWDIVRCGVSLPDPTTVVRVRVGADRAGGHPGRGRGPGGRRKGRT